MAVGARRLRSSAQSRLKWPPLLTYVCSSATLDLSERKHRRRHRCGARRCRASRRRTSAFAEARCAVGASHGACPQRARACPHASPACQLTLSVCFFCSFGRLRRGICQWGERGVVHNDQVFNYINPFNVAGVQEWGCSPLATFRVQITVLCSAAYVERGLGQRASFLSG
jgi:hypothetical protein